MSRERKTEIEEILVEVLEDYGIVEYPMSIGKVAAALGVELIPHSSLPFDKLILALRASEDAFSLSTPDYSDVQIVFDDRGSYLNRARFSGGHEIGHIILQHPEDGGIYEDEANYFGGYLLAPHPLILSMGCDTKAAKVAERFGISVPCASFAIDQARARQREGGPWRPHEQWLLDHAIWKGGGLLARA